MGRTVYGDEYGFVHNIRFSYVVACFCLQGVLKRPVPIATTPPTQEGDIDMKSGGDTSSGKRSNDTEVAGAFKIRRKKGKFLPRLKQIL